MGRTLFIVVTATALLGCQQDSAGGEGGDDDTSGTNSSSMTSPTVDPDGTGESSTTAQDSSSSEETGPPLQCDESELSALYTRYVEPFVSGQARSSCAECHMTGIDISMYAQDTPCDTMQCMVDMDMVNFADPANSQLLAMLAMGDPNSSVFDVNNEYDAMMEWINWSASCHGEVCGEIESACTLGTNAPSTGVDPIGDCSEDDLLQTFWDTVLVDQGRCTICHTDWAELKGTFGDCQDVSECSGPQLCLNNKCMAPGPAQAPHFFEGPEGPLEFPEDKTIGMNIMYNTMALALVDEGSPLDSLLLTKPLYDGENMHITDIYGDDFTMENIPAGTGDGIEHGGTSKFNFGCHGQGEPVCAVIDGPFVVDCRTNIPCGDACPDGLTCQEGTGETPASCRVAGSVCDNTYVNYAKFVYRFQECEMMGQ